MTKCCYSYNSMCSCTLGCMPVCWTLFHSYERLVGLCLQLVFRSTCCALTRAGPNTGTPCFRTFGPGTRTWPVFAQGGGGYISVSRNKETVTILFNEWSLCEVDLPKAIELRFLGNPCRPTSLRPQDSFGLLICDNLSMNKPMGPRQHQLCPVTALKSPFKACCAGEDRMKVTNH